MDISAEILQVWREWSDIFKLLHEKIAKQEESLNNEEEIGFPRQTKLNKLLTARLDLEGVLREVLKS